MMGYQEVLDLVSKEYQNILGDNLVGIYVHGSIAFGCYNPNKSDIDFIVVVKENLSLNQKVDLIEVLLSHDKEVPVRGFEISVILLEDTLDIKYPTHFTLHYSNLHRANTLKNIVNYINDMHGDDPDLVAHFMIIKYKGIVLYGLPICEVFGSIDKRDYIDSITADVRFAEEDIINHPLYTILNLCRVLGYIKDELILSKKQGGEWGIKNLDTKYTQLIYTALSSYTTDSVLTYDNDMLVSFAKYCTSFLI
ncbi:MAG: aminoglycoside adenylyltransferase domain-containing protein [Bacillota bacterium]